MLPIAYSIQTGNPENESNFKLFEFDKFPSAFEEEHKRSESEASESLLQGDDFSAFPNPFSGIIQFETQSSSGGDVLIYDLRGVFVDKLALKPEQFTISYDGTSLSSGMYVAALVSKTNEFSWVKVVKY